MQRRMSQQISESQASSPQNSQAPTPQAGALRGTASTAPTPTAMAANSPPPHPHAHGVPHQQQQQQQHSQYSLPPGSVTPYHYGGAGGSGGDVVVPELPQGYQEVDSPMGATSSTGGRTPAASSSTTMMAASSRQASGSAPKGKSMGGGNATTTASKKPRGLTKAQKVAASTVAAANTSKPAAATAMAPAPASSTTPSLVPAPLAQQSTPMDTSSFGGSVTESPFLGSNTGPSPDDHQPTLHASPEALETNGVGGFAALDKSGLFDMADMGDFGLAGFEGNDLDMDVS